MSRRSRLALFDKRPPEARDATRFRQPRSGELYNDWLDVAMFLAESAERTAFDPHSLPPFPIQEADGTPANMRARLAAIEAALDAFHNAAITPLPVTAPHGPAARGDRRRRLTAEDVCHIRSSGKTGVLLALELGVHPNTVNEARRGVKWPGLDCSQLDNAEQGEENGEVMDFMEDHLPGAPHPFVFGM